MIQDEVKRRLFFGAEIDSAWPEELPRGRILKENSRHLTLAFLGNTSFESLEKHLREIPLPSFIITPLGVSSKVLFLPAKTPRVVSLDVEWITYKDAIEEYQKKLLQWLKTKGYTFSHEERPFLSHVTLARSPFSRGEWEMLSLPLPIAFKALHLYESVGNLSYKSLWSHPLLPSFQEKEHTADIAFTIYAETIKDLYLNAQMALAFKYPALTPFISSTFSRNSLEELVMELNQLVAKVDGEIGCPFKAISFHGEIDKKERLLQWEMIVDV